MNFLSILDLGKQLVDLFFGAADGLLYALIILVVLDYVTGICVAVHMKKASSEIGAKGIAKKVGMFALISVSHVVDTFLLNSSDAVRSVTTTFYICVRYKNSRVVSTREFLSV